MIDLLFVLLLGVILLISWYLYSYLYIDYRVVKFRQRLFYIRNELFIEAEKGNIAFDSGAYQMTRETINGMLRFAHQISLFRYLLSKIIYRSTLAKDGDKYYNELLMNLNKLTPEQQKLIKKIRFQMHISLLSHLIRSSLLLLPLVVIARFILKTIDKMGDVLSYVRAHQRIFSIIDAQAIKA